MQWDGYARLPGITHEIDDGNTVDLFEVSGQPGVFTTKPLVLMSDQVDDDYVIDGAEDNAANDRSFRVMPGADIKCEYEMAPNAKAEFSYKVEHKKTIKVKGFILKKETLLDTVDVIPYQSAALQMRRAAERMAQTGIYMDWSLRNVESNPPQVNLDGADGLAEPIEINSHTQVQMTTESKKLCDGLPVAGDEIPVYFVNKFNTVVGAQGKSNPLRAMLPGEQAYANKIFIASDKLESSWTVGHELFHILGNAIHPPQFYDFPTERTDYHNLFHNTSPSEGVESTKRLSRYQTDEMLKSPLAK